MGIFHDTKSERFKKSIEACLNDEARALILKKVMETPGITADRLDTSIAGKLVQEGILIMEREGGIAGYYVTADARSILIEHMPLHYQCPGLLKE
jgi:hypothetical protein